MNKTLCGAACVALIMPCGTPALAQTMNINVPVGQQGSLTSQGTLAAKEAIKNIPGGADVVPAKTFKEGYALSMKDMLATTPGVLAQPRWGEESRLSIRGSGLSRSFHLRGITLLQDGVPFNFSDGSGDFQEIDPLILQHVEVYRGGQGLRYGAATLGGAINMVTPTARSVEHNALLRIEAGSHQTLRLHAQAAKTFKHADIIASATSAVSDGARLQSEQNNRRFSSNVGFTLNPDAETRFYLSWNDLEQEVPGTISKFNALNNPKTIPSINATNDYARDIRSLRVANKTAFKLDNGWLLEGGAYANDKFLYHPIFQVLDQNSLDLGTFARMEGDFGLNSYRNDFIVGINVGHGVNDAKRFVNIGGHRGNLTANSTQTADNYELYGENRFHFAPQWSLITGLQATLAMRDYEDHLNAANDADKTYKSINPKIGVMWKPNSTSEVYASLTRSSEAPTFSELVQGAIVGFVPVDMQKAWTAEIGTRGEDGAFSWDATLYHSRLKGELLNYTVTSDVPASTFNARDTIHQGLELGAGWQASDTISFKGIYNFNDFRFDGDNQFNDNDLAGAPPHQIRLSARYEKNGFYVEPNVEFTPEAAWVDYANTLKSDTPVLLGAKAGWEANQNITIFVDARNLADEENIASFSTITDARTVGQNVFYPGEGRSLYAGISLKF